MSLSALKLENKLIYLLIGNRAMKDICECMRMLGLYVHPPLAAIIHEYTHEICAKSLARAISGPACIISVVDYEYADKSDLHGVTEHAHRDETFLYLIATGSSVYIRFVKSGVFIIAIECGEIGCVTESFADLFGPRGELRATLDSSFRHKLARWRDLQLGTCVPLPSDYLHPASGLAESYMRAIDALWRALPGIVDVHAHKCTSWCEWAGSPRGALNLA